MLGKAGRKALTKYWGMRPEEIAEREGIEIQESDNMPGRFDDVIVSGTIFLPRGLLTPEKRWRIAHCLGHHFMHNGNQVWCHDNSGVYRPKQEHQANVFAACLLTGREYDTPWSQEELQAVKVGRLRR